MQQFLMIGAPIAPQHREALREKLASMNTAFGLADPANTLLPFGEFAQLHTARFVMVEDPSLADRFDHAERYPVEEPDWLIFLAVCDGSVSDLITQMAQRSEDGLTAIFSKCIGFDADQPIRQWMSDHRLKPKAAYRNWPGRNMVQIREEAELHEALRAVRLDSQNSNAEEVASLLRDKGAEFTLTPITKPSFGAKVSNFLSLLSLPIIGLLLSPLLITLLVPFLMFIRVRERRDPVLAPPIDRDRNNAILAMEDHDVTNAYSAVGSRKPGCFFYVFSRTVLWVIDWGARHIYKRGRLARVNTIHFASWTFLDGSRRLFFASVYDGSREAYNDDFINKVAFGLNLAFMSALGYPRTRWMVLEGAWHEQDFKRYLGNHQLPNQIWYKAYPNLTVYDLARNARIREGLERPLKGAALRRWIAEI